MSNEYRALAGQSCSVLKNGTLISLMNTDKRRKISVQILFCEGNQTTLFNW